MKIRTSFVSNSSSTSFTCQHCGGSESGWDYGLEECYMFQCKNGHIVHQSHNKNWKDGKENKDAIKKMIDQYFDEEKKHMIYFRGKYGYSIFGKKAENRDPTDEEVRERLENDFKECYIENVPSKYCPLCNFESVSQSDLVWYLCRKLDIQKSDVPNMIQKEFSSYDKFMNAIRKSYENKK